MASKKVNKAKEAVKEAVKDAVESSVDLSNVKTKDEIKADFKDAVTHAAIEAVVTKDKDAAKEEVVSAVKVGLFQLLKNAVMKALGRR